MMQGVKREKAVQVGQGTRSHLSKGGCKLGGDGIVGGANVRAAQGCDCGRRCTHASHLHLHRTQAPGAPLS